MKQIDMRGFKFTLYGATYDAIAMKIKDVVKDCDYIVMVAVDSYGRIVEL